MDKLKDFLEGSKSCTITMHGCYDLSMDEFVRAYQEFLDNGHNELDNHTEIRYFGWEANEDICTYKHCIWDEKQIEKVKKILINDGFWDIDNLWCEETKKNVVDKLKYSINYHTAKQKKKRRRREAITYTSNKEIRNKIFKRDNYKCNICETKRELTLDHIIPVEKGGKDEIDNLQVLCQSCNSKKGHRIYEMV